MTDNIDMVQLAADVLGMPPKDTTQHTPGPWTRHVMTSAEPMAVVPENGGTPWVAHTIYIAHGDKFVATCDMRTTRNAYHYPDTMAENEANAAIVMAAPDMLDALRGALAAYQDGTPSKAIPAIVAALSKATLTAKVPA